MLNFAARSRIVVIKLPGPLHVALRPERIVRPWLEQMDYQRITENLLPGWNRGGADFSRKTSLIFAYIGYFSYPISVLLLSHIRVMQS